MEILSTIQKREKLNEVRTVDEKGNGGAFHIYEISAGVPAEPKDKDGEQLHKELSMLVKFQDGARKLETSKHGVLDTDLLEIVRHRLTCFQEGEFRRENAIALTHIEEALLWMNKRVEDRIERNVLGTNNK